MDSSVLIVDGDWVSSSTHKPSLLRQCSLVDDRMKGGADPLLSQEPASVLPSYASLMDTDVGHDFSEDKLLKSGNLYSLYLLNSDSSSSQLKLKDATNNDDNSASPGKDKKDNGDTDEEIDVETDGVKEAIPEEKPMENGHYDALFEGMPFTELRGKEVGPCSYCNLWRTIRFMSYCGRFPFCSVYCTKKFAVYKRERGELSEKTPEDIKAINKLKVPTLFENQRARPLFPSSQLPDAERKRPRVCTNGTTEGAEGIKKFEWTDYLESLNTEAAPVKCFHHAPLAKEWKANLIGALVEVQNRDPDDTKDCFWIARIIRVAGYKAKLRFEGYGMDSSHDFWIHLCKADCYPVNGAEKAGKQLKPPKEVLDKLGCNWQEHTTRVAHSGSPTFSLDRDKLAESLTSPFKEDTQLEVIYKRQVSSTCVATIKKVVADRIYVQYDNCKDTSKDFWFHQTSPLIHPVGWSQRVHHPLIATAAYKSEALDKGRRKKGGPRDAPWEVFQLPKPIPDEQNFCVGMKLEAIDPLKLGSISVATVVQTLGDCYLMIAIDGCLHDVASWFCYHATSPALLPIGFCEYHQIELVPPRGYEGKFDWDDYLKATNSIAAPVELFHQKKIDPSFRVGQKLEAVDLIESGFICAATILKLAGPLLRVHFDGWDPSYDQWLNCQSPDIYPVGWCEMVGYPLQPPRVHDPTSHMLPAPVFKNGKKHRSTPLLHSHEKRKRSFSGSASYPTTSDYSSRIVDSIYSFSDTEDHASNKPPKISKKDKSDRQSKKERKSKEKKAKSKSHSKSRHKDDAKDILQKLLSHSTPNLGGWKTVSVKKFKSGLMSGSNIENCEDSLLDSPLAIGVLPDSPLSSSLDSFTSLNNGGGGIGDGTSIGVSPADPLQMSPRTSTLETHLQSVLSKTSCSSLMNSSAITLSKSTDTTKNNDISPCCPGTLSNTSQKDVNRSLLKFLSQTYKSDGSRHKNKKSKKSKKMKDKDRSKKEKKCKKKDKEKKRKIELGEKSLVGFSDPFPEMKTSKLAALLKLPGQISFPEKKTSINGFLGASGSNTLVALPKPKITEPEHDPFAFETDEEVEQKSPVKHAQLPNTSLMLMNSPPVNVAVKTKPTAKKRFVNKVKRSQGAMPAAYLTSPSTVCNSQVYNISSFSGEGLSAAGCTQWENHAMLSSHPSTPQTTQVGTPISTLHKPQPVPIQSPINTPSSSTEPPQTPAQPPLVELRKLPLNLHPRDAQNLLRALQWQDSSLYRHFLSASAPFTSNRRNLTTKPRNLSSESPVPVLPIRQSPQSAPRLINTQGMFSIQNQEDMIMLRPAMPLARLTTTNQLSKTQKLDVLPRLDPQDVISALPDDRFQANLIPNQPKYSSLITQNSPRLRLDLTPVTRQRPTFATSETMNSPSEPVLPSPGPHMRTNPMTNPPSLASPQAAPSPRTLPSPRMELSPHTASPQSPYTMPVPSPQSMTSPQQYVPGGLQNSPSPRQHSPAVQQGFPHLHLHPLSASTIQPQPQTIHRQDLSPGGPNGSPNIMNRLPPLETILKSLNSTPNPICPTPASYTGTINQSNPLPATGQPNRPRLARPQSFPDASLFSNNASATFQLSSSSFHSPTSPNFHPSTESFIPQKSTKPSNRQTKTKAKSSARMNFSTLRSAQPASRKQDAGSFPSSPSSSNASFTTSYKLPGFQSSGTSVTNMSSAKSGSASLPCSPPSPRNAVQYKNKPSTPTDSGPGCIVEEFTLKRIPRPEIGIVNPWHWGIGDVIQFLIDAGERGCVETFSKQGIDGRKFMSLSKDQIAKLTGMKVAPSLKIYQQIVRLRSLFPTPDTQQKQV